MAATAKRVGDLIRTGPTGMQEVVKVKGDQVAWKKSDGTLVWITRTTEPTAKTEPEPEPIPAPAPALPEPEPEPEPIDLATVLDNVRAFLTDHVVFTSEHEATAAALWAVHTHVVNLQDSTPRLTITAPTAGSGKTRLLEALAEVCRRAQMAGSISSAGLARIVEQTQPTLLIDEYQNIFGVKGTESTDLVSVINTGYRKSGHIMRCVGTGEAMHVERFSTHAAVALAGKGAPPPDILSRSVVIHLKRRKADESVLQNLRVMHARGAALRELLELWATYVTEISPVAMPAGVVDRAEEVWSPLISIADMAGTEWANRAREACTTILDVDVSAGISRSVDRETIGLRLLADIRSVFEDDGSDRLSTALMIAKLLAIEEGPWRNVDGYRHELDPTALADMLDAFGIKPRTIRIGKATPRGYMREWFEDAWSRNL